MVSRFYAGLRAAIPAGGVLLMVLLCAGTARAEPPITSPQDAACRLEARARVFMTPDPMNIGMRAIGQRIYRACMARVTMGQPRRVGRKVRHRPRYRY